MKYLLIFMLLFVGCGVFRKDAQYSRTVIAEEVECFIGESTPRCIVKIDSEYCTTNFLVMKGQKIKICTSDHGFPLNLFGDSNLEHECSNKWSLFRCDY